MENFQENIKQWVLIDNETKKLREKIKILKEKQNNYNNSILNYIENNNLENATIEISDGTLKLQRSKQTSTLTYKFLEESLINYCNDENKAKEIVRFIKNKREIKYTNDLKRFYSS